MSEYKKAETYFKNEKKRIVSFYIKEYAGQQFAFLKDYLDKDCTEYVISNIDKIAYQQCFKQRIRKTPFKRIAQNELKEYVLQYCKDTIEYVNKNIEYLEIKKNKVLNELQNENK